MALDSDLNLVVHQCLVERSQGTGLRAMTRIAGAGYASDQAYHVLPKHG
jgi:hypothetical protein